MYYVITIVVVYALPIFTAIILPAFISNYVVHKNNLSPETCKSFHTKLVNYIDIYGTIIVPLLSLLLSFYLGYLGLIFGWDKKLSHIRDSKDSASNASIINKVAFLAKLITNLALAIGWQFLSEISSYADHYIALPLYCIAQVGKSVNIWLLLVNLLLALPVAGIMLLISWITKKPAQQYLDINLYMIILLALLLISGGFSFLLQPTYSIMIGLIDIIF